MAGKRAKKKHKAKEEPASIEGAALPEDEKIKVLRIALKVFLTVVFFAYIFSLALKYPLNDPDVFWHLKTGTSIIETRTIPDDDQFSFTTPKPLNENQVRGLRTQWLGQVVFALAEKAGGIVGVVMFRNVLVVLPMLALFLWLVRKGFGVYRAMSVVVLPGILLAMQLFYAFERPQAFSFLFVLLLVMLIERLRSPGLGKFDFSMVALPVLMALWANLHAGFIVGNVIIFIYFASELFMRAWRKFKGSSVAGARPAFFAVCALSVPASFINPNAHHLFLEYFTGLSAKFFRDFAQTITGGGRQGWVEQVVLEFKPLHYFYKVLFYKWIMVYWIFTGVLVASLALKYWARKSIDLAEIFTVALIAFFANYYARGLMFSLTVLPFYMGKTLIELRLPPLNYRKLAVAVVAALLILTVVLPYTTYGNNISTMLKPRIAPLWITPWYPLALSDFLDVAKPRGPMYNFYTWGGFLIWRLYPQYKVFIDGRALDRDISWTADGILKTFPKWREQLDAFDVNFIVIPVVFRESGDIIPLAPALVADNNWRLVFLQSNSAVFVRDVPENREIIGRFNMDKRFVFREIVNVENLLLMGMPDNPTYHTAKGDALFALGQYADAKAVYSRFPRHNARQLEALRNMGY